MTDKCREAFEKYKVPGLRGLSYESFKLGYNQLSEENTRLKGHVIDANRGAATNAGAMQVFMDRNDKLSEENARLREALRAIINVDDVWSDAQEIAAECLGSEGSDAT